MARKLIIFTLLILIFSCQKENRPPTCVILKPSSNSIFHIGDTISVEVLASDPEGSIENVTLQFNGTNVTTLTQEPYTYGLKTNPYQPDNYLLKAVAKDKGDLEDSDEINLTLSATTPSVSITLTDSITDSTARVRYNVISDGGSEVTSSGVCWSTIQNPSLSGNHTAEAAGPGENSSRISELLCGTIYYARAYATNEKGTAYSNQVTFTTGSCYSLPTVTTGGVAGITEYTAICGGGVTSNGGSRIQERGICWSTSHNPTITDNYSTEGGGLGSFTSTLSGLNSFTDYYIRAYATNIEGTAYGEEVTFKTKWVNSVRLVDHDGNWYNTIQIGNQVWMKENLRVTHFSDGEEIPYTLEAGDWESLAFTDKAYCWYNNQPPEGDVYGAIYSIGAAMNGIQVSSVGPEGIQGVCPDGWLLPGDSDWKEMEIYLGMSEEDADATGWRGTNEGGKLKEPGISKWESPNTGATNSSGFSAIPVGGRDNLGEFYDFSRSARYFAAPNLGDAHPWVRALDYNKAAIFRDFHDGHHGEYVRCIKGISQGSLPQVVTLSPDQITQTSGQSGGEVLYGGESLVTAHGICWATHENPKLSDNYTVDGTGTGNFISTMTGLRPFTQYWVTAYATNGAGTTYANDLSFTTLWDNSTVIDIDGNEYQTVKIGDQIWMQENLKVTHYSDGSEIPLVEDSLEWGSLGYDDKAYCLFENSDSIGDIYGALYTWAAATNGSSGSSANPSGLQGVCPVDWHLPSDEEWKQLELFIGMSQSEVEAWDWRGTLEGQKLKSTNYWTNGGQGTDESGFTALPGGGRFTSGAFNNLGGYGYWWSSLEDDIYLATSRTLGDSYNTVYRTNNNKDFGFSIRCIRDK